MRLTRTSHAILRALASVLFVSAFTLSPLVGAQPAQAARAITGTSQHATARVITHYQRNEGATGASAAASLRAAAERQLPALSPVGARLRNAKAAVGNLRSARAAAPATATPDDHGTSLDASFAGMQSSAAICPPVGCNPPDMGLASSPSWVLQGVNTSWAVYDTAGHIQAGWPKTFFDFYGVPDRGACAGGVPFMSDPRALYDPGTQRFFAASLEVEGAFGVNDCPFLSIYWIAVSATSNPNGVWNVYAFDMTLGTTNGADFTMVGFDGADLYFSANMFNQAGTAYEYAEIFGVNKRRMEANRDVTAPGFFNLLVNGPQGTYVADTVQPAQTEGSTGDAGGEPFVDTLNGFDPASGHSCSSPTDACQGLAVWTFRPGEDGPPSLRFSFAPTKPYYFPPAADQTSCLQCIDSSDLRISATPVARNGSVYVGWETGIDNGTQIVPGIEWAQVRTGDEGGDTHNVDGGQGAHTVANDYYFFRGGDDAVVYPALMVDNSGTLFMVFDRMSSTVNPQVRLAVRHPGGTFQGKGMLIKAGQGPYRPTRCGHDIPVCRWGDYSATSYDGTGGNHVWFAGQFTIPVTTFSRNWGTWIGEV